MGSRNLYVQLVIRVLLLVAVTFVMVFLFFKNQYVLSGIVSLVLISQTFFLIKYVNHSNRKIAYFFEAVKNEDFSLRFPEYGNVKSLQELNRSLNMLNDIVQKMHLENQAQEQYFQEILKQANIGILTFNAEGHILFSNPTVKKLLNREPLNHIKQLAQVNPDLYQLFVELKPFEQKSFQLTNEREKIQLAIKSTPITLSKKKLLLVVIQDIHKELDEKETDSWLRLIRVMTHEIMNSITPITSISESILKYYQTDKGLVSLDQFSEEHIKNTAKGLTVIKEQGNDLMSFVQSYRSFLNVPAPDKKIVLIQELLERVKVLMEQEGILGNSTFEISQALKDMELFVDEKQIAQVLINLCKNALQSLAIQEEGTLRVSAGKDSEGNSFIEVWDNGPGISAEIIEEIFVPFFTTKNTGTGIGLSLSKQIMRLHGGNLKLKSIPNKETVFSLVFPK
ncbi:MAG: ATP-binding protein [Cellulophaga sp.]